MLILISCSSSSKEFKIAIPELTLSVDIYEVTTGEFAEFVRQTQFSTTADSLQWSAVFNLDNNIWQPFPMANWEKPDGVNLANEDIPVTQVSYYDACAYCDWKNGRLPTAVEWDVIAGAVVSPGNVWQGVFPVNDLAKDGFDRVPSPVGTFQPNQLGIFDLFGNVWEWTSTVEGGQMIIKGGSYLCDESFCSGYFPDKYQRTPKDSGLNHLGFRCVYDD
ncbi:MAG: SUMF1/EgtB/PvdO family nonheme iron enzyme [Bacteroidota bacterium]